jgi:hypothetical protein
MSKSKANTPQQLQQAYQLAKSGNRAEAQQIVRAVLSAEPSNADAWYMAGFLADSNDNKIKALERALAINPLHQQARQALSNLKPIDDSIDGFIALSSAQPAPAAPIIIQSTTEKKKQSGLSSCLAAIVILIVIGAGISFFGGSSGGAGSGMPTQNPNPSYSNIDSRDLLTYPDRHSGKYVQISGRVFHVLGDNDFQIYLGDDGYDAVFINSPKRLNGVYEKSKVRIRGMVYGFHTGKNSFGGEIRQPLIVYAEITSLE